MRITEEMVVKLNRELLQIGCCFTFEFCAFGMLGNTKIELVPLNDKFIHSSIINPTDEFYSYLENFFKQEGIEELSYNNTGSIIWAKNGWNKSKAN